MSTYEKRSYKTKRNTARGIIIHDGSLLLIERKRPGLHYYSTPGGGIEPGETPERALRRELHEETSLDLKVEREIYLWQEGLHQHYFFLCKYISGEPRLRDDAEENQKGPGDTHSPKWIKFEDVRKSSFGYWEPLKDIILHDIKNGFPKHTKIITTLAVV